MISVCIKASSGWCLVRVPYISSVTSRTLHYMAIDEANEQGCLPGLEMPGDVRLIFDVVSQADILYNRFFSNQETLVMKDELKEMAR